MTTLHGCFAQCVAYRTFVNVPIQLLVFRPLSSGHLVIIPRIVDHVKRSANRKFKVFRSDSVVPHHEPLPKSKTGWNDHLGATRATPRLGCFCALLL